MSQRKTMIMLASLFASAAICPPLSAKTAEPADMAERQVQQGEASWYGPGFHGRRTASGERFDTNAMTAAHRSLPFGTRVRVVNKHTGQSVVVRINDRGPYARGRVIDLSRASAQALGISGVAAVEVIQL
jgi:rare lipoprotein A